MYCLYIVRCGSGGSGGGGTWVCKALDELNL